FANTGDESLGAITTAGTITIIDDEDIDDPVDVAAGPDGNVWFTSSDADAIGRVTPTGGLSFFTHPFIDRPLGIAASDDGRLWFTSNATSSIGAITAVSCGPGRLGPFRDVGPAHTFCPDVDWLVGRGITTGYPDGTYRPGDVVSRQSMAAFL